MKPLSRALERYALKVHQYGRITGVALGAHAIEDAYLILHAAVGCKFKGVSQIFLNDWGRQPQRRETWTEVAEIELIEGAAARIGPHVRSSHGRYSPGLIVVTSSSALALTGEDIAAAVAEADRTVACPVRYVPGQGYGGDLFDGYAAVIDHVLGLIPWAATKPEPKRVSVVGYFFDRYEGDHAGNLQQIGLLLGELGYTLDTVLLSGQSVERLRQAARSASLIVLPCAHRLGRSLEATGRRVVRTGLPMGLRGTSAWLEQVGRALGVPEGKTRVAAERLAGHTRRSVAMLRDRAQGGRCAVFGEHPMAVGLCDIAESLGLAPLLVGVRGRSLGGTAEAKSLLAGIGVPLRADVQWLDDPSVSRVRHHLKELIDERRIVAALGSAGELCTLPRWAPETQAGRFSARHHGFARIIVGYPSTGYHTVLPSPFFGYGGVVVMAQRLLDHLYDGPPAP